MKRRNFLRGSAGFSLTLFPWIKQQGFWGSFIEEAGQETQDPSAFLAIHCNEHAPAFDFFSIDSLGRNMLSTNIILKDEKTKAEFRRESGNGKISYYAQSQITGSSPAWELNLKKTSFSISSNHSPDGNSAFVFQISQPANHATLLGRMSDEDGSIFLPGIMHFPDMGTLRITCNVPGISVAYKAKRSIEHPFVRIEFPAATAASPERIYHFEGVSIHPQIEGIDRDERYDCFRRNFISIFQLNPFLKLLANNSASDACAFTLFTYAAVALKTPPLAEGLRAVDLVRETLDRYLAGHLGYGLLGYDYNKNFDIPESATSCNYLDSYPSLLIAACYYASGSGDKDWFNRNYAGIMHWANKMLMTDSDQDGLLEFCLSGNSGSWKGDYTMRPANWWDTIGFGHKDAYSNALAYHALKLLEETAGTCGHAGDAALFKSRAAKLKAIYTSTFYNPATGVLAGWKSADGQLHDYYFTFVSGVAICYDLIEHDLANRIMDSLLLKMKDVGFNNFELGLPGNLIPVIRADYTDLNPEVGGGKRADNLDGFQIYENGGTTACFTYYTIRALQILGRDKESDNILLPLLKSMSAGNFQGRCANGKTRDWKSWTGECWGYEGFLVDNYMFLLTVLTRK